MMLRRLFLTGFSIFLTSQVFAQLPVNNDILLWLDATDTSTLFQDTALTTPAGNGDPVAGWRDKSGNDFHATQSDSFLTPTYNSTAMNGLPAVRLDGIDGDVDSDKPAPEMVMSVIVSSVGSIVACNGND